jgi:hypothetical protein
VDPSLGHPIALILAGLTCSGGSVAAYRLSRSLSSNVFSVYRDLRGEGDGSASWATWATRLLLCRRAVGTIRAARA